MDQLEMNLEAAVREAVCASGLTSDVEMRVNRFSREVANGSSQSEALWRALQGANTGGIDRGTNAFFSAIEKAAKKPSIFRRVSNFARERAESAFVLALTAVSIWAIARIPVEPGQQEGFVRLQLLMWGAWGITCMVGVTTPAEKIRILLFALGRAIGAFFAVTATLFWTSSDELRASFHRLVEAAIRAVT